MSTVISAPIRQLFSGKGIRSSFQESVNWSQLRRKCYQVESAEAGQIGLEQRGLKGVEMKGNLSI
eukprot:6172014-Pleurochrysis_carterae.AAC.2